MSSPLLRIELDGKERFLKAPSNFSSLLEVIEETFGPDLPIHWSLQYEDDEGDLVMLITPEGFESLLEDLERSKTPITVLVIPREDECMVLSRSKPSKEIIQLSDSSRESYNLIDEDVDSEKKRKTTSQIFEEILAPVGNILEEKEASLEESRKNERVQPLEMIGLLPRPLQYKIAEYLQSEKVYSAEQSSQTDIRQEENRNQIELIESSCQTLQLDKQESMKDQVSQTHNNSLANQDKGLQYDPEMMNLSQIDKDKVEQAFSDDKNFEYELLERDAGEKSIEVSSPLVKEEEEKVEKEVVEVVEAESDELVKKEKVVVTEEMMNNRLKLIRESIARANKKALHVDCRCDGCGATPVLGARYRCSECDDFDFCENCEATKTHPHLFFKLNTVEDYSKFKGKNLWPFNYFLDEKKQAESSLRQLTDSKFAANLKKLLANAANLYNDIFNQE